MSYSNKFASILEIGCAYCRTAEALIVAIFEFEYIIPRSAGGETVFENLCLSCPTCNRYKGTFQTALDLTTQQTVPLFHPHCQVWEEHFKWSEDATELVGLTLLVEQRLLP